MKKIRCAVVGVGFLGKFHAEKFALAPSAELIGICDLNLDRAREIAALYHTTAYNDYHELLGKVDAVSIAATTTAHYALAKEFLLHHAHVLVEKPITSTLDEAEALVTLAKQNKLILQVGHLERFNPVLVKLRDLLKKPLFVESLRIAPFKLRGTDVNVILDLMIHDIDIVQSLVKSKIKNIYANGAPVLSNKIDIATARVEFENNCTANFTASRISLKPKRILRIFQNNAYFAGDLDQKTLSIHLKSDKEIAPGIPEITHEELSLDKGDALFDEIKAFLNSIANNTPPIISGEDGKQALQTAINITTICQTNLEKMLADT